MGWTVRDEDNNILCDNGSLREATTAVATSLMVTDARREALIAASASRHPAPNSETKANLDEGNPSED